MNKLRTKKETIFIDFIQPNPFNPNKMDDYTFQKMKDTIASEGLFGSVYVRPLPGGTYQLLDGQHRVQACKELGFTEIPCEVCEDTMTDKEVKFWTIYFNNTKGKDDIQKRAKLFEEMEQGQAQLLPFSEDQIENEKRLFKFDFSQYDEQKEIKEKERTNAISFTTTEHIKDLWNFCCEFAKMDRGQDQNEMIKTMIDLYVSLMIDSDRSLTTEEKITAYNKKQQDF
jgi:ParB-like nuclease family protein